MKEELIKIINEFIFFDENLTPIEEPLDELRKTEDMDRKTELYNKFILERDIVNRLLTIENSKIWKASNSGFYEKYYDEKLTNTNQQVDVKTGILPKWGVLMYPEEFKIYEEVYNELFELEIEK